MPIAYRQHFWAILLIGMMNILVFSQGLDGPWVLDDEANIYTNQQLLLNDLNPHQLHIASTAPLASYPYTRGLSYLSFALNYYFSGQEFSQFDFKLTNLIIHLVNALLAYLIATLVIKTTLTISQGHQALLAIAITLCWSCHPIQVSSVLYAVQRMTLLSGTTVLLGCLLFLKFRLSPSYLNTPTIKILPLVIVLSICVLVGFHFKETAVLLPVYLLALEICLRPFSPPNINLDRAMLILGTFTALIALGYLVFELGDIRKSYSFRNFTLEERSLTQPRVLWWYLKLLLIPQLSDFSLFMDDYSLSKSITQPITTLTSIIAWSLLIAFGVFFKKNWLLSSCLIWYLGGHLIESTFLPLEIAFEHRNYLPSLAPIAMAIALLSWATNRLISNTLIAYLPVALPIILLAFLCTIRASFWGDKVMFITQQVENRPHSTRANGAAGVFYATRDPVRALNHYATAAQHNETSLLPVSSQYSILMVALNLYDQAEKIAADNEQDITAGIRQKWTKQELTKKVDDLETEVEFRIRKYAVSPQVLSSLEIATYCAVSAQLSCKNPATVLRWVNIALENPKKCAVCGPMLNLHKSRLLAASGKANLALTLMEKTVTEHPENNYYKIKLAELYYTLEMDKEFKQIVQSIPLELIQKYVPESGFEYILSILDNPK